MATPKPSTQRGLNQDFPTRLADDLARRYARMNQKALRLIRRLLVPAMISGDEAAIQEALEAIDLALAEEMPDAKVERDARRIGERVNRNHRSLFFAGLSAAIGVRILGSDDPGGLPPTPPVLPGAPTPRGGPRLVARLNFNPTILTDQFVDQNIRLISTLRTGIVQALGDQVTRDIILGGGVTGAELVPPTREELTRRLLLQWEEKGVPSRIPIRRTKLNGEPVFITVENHAALIARDQVSKLNGQLNRARQQAAGITDFVWETRKDSRVRPEHRDLQGRTFSWQEGWDGVFPGQPIQCRCWARAVVDRDQVLASGDFIPVDAPVGTPFTERGRPGVFPTDPGPGAFTGPLTSFEP